MLAPGRLSLPHLMFVGKARSLPYSGAPDRCFTQIGTILSQKIRLGWKKHSILFGPYASCEENKLVLPIQPKVGIFEAQSLVTQSVGLGWRMTVKEFFN